MTDFAKMSGPKLEAEKDKLGEAHSKVWREISRRDNKDYRMSEIRELAKSGDALAVKTVAADNKHYEAISELETRKKYHGGNKPIRRTSWV